MRYFFFLSLYLIGGLMLATAAYCAQVPLSSSQNSSKKEINTDQIKVLVKNTSRRLTANKPVIIRFQLVKGNQAVTLNDLNVVHTKKIHVLVIDPSLQDYHHVHPVEENQTFVFSFTPKKDSSYRMWIDITPRTTKEQEFIMADLNPAPSNPVANEKVALNHTEGSYKFTLKLNGQLKVGNDVMATISVTKNDKPFMELEPVMGAFAHVVGFSSDYSTIMHIHPMGKEPSTPLARGGPELMFHIGLKKAGFIKLFAQFRINGKNVYAPFGIEVK